MKKILAIIITLLGVTSPSWAEVGFVQQVINGTTFKLISGETVKMIGVDLNAAEDNQMNEERSKAISSFVRGFISGNLVELEYDAKQKDEEGNLLAYVWFEYPQELDMETMPLPANYEVSYLKDNEGEGHFLVFLNATMIKSGFAKPTLDGPNTKHAELFKKNYEEAQQTPSQGELANANVHINISSATR